MAQKIGHKENTTSQNTDKHNGTKMRKGIICSIVKQSTRTTRQQLRFEKKQRKEDDQQSTKAKRKREANLLLSGLRFPQLLLEFVSWLASQEAEESVAQKPCRRQTVRPLHCCPCKSPKYRHSHWCNHGQWGE